MLTRGPGTTIPFLEEIAVVTERPIMIAALLYNATNPAATGNIIAAINDAQARGREMYGQVSCCPLTFEFTMRSPYPFEDLAAWRPAITAPDEAALSRAYADQRFRQAVRDELARPATVRLFNNEWQKLAVTEVADPANRDREGLTVAALAAASGADPC